MDIESLINHEYGIRTGLAVARLLPKSAGYALARFLAGQIARRDQAWIHAVRSNQWVVSGGRSSARELDVAVQKTFEYRAYSIVDLYHNIQLRERILSAVEFDESAQLILERSRSAKEGTVVVIPHVANYELAGLAAALHGGVGVALTLPEQPGGYKYHDKIRKDYGIEAMPASMASFKYATQVLREGGVVGTGLDRPLPDAGYKPMFFGRNASLPVHYVVLAMKAKVPMVMAYVKRQDNGIYKAFASGLIPVTDYGDRRSTILGNAERMLELIEEPIRQDPYQWAMFYSVWPDVAPNE